jgi:hypothetical protein
VFFEVNEIESTNKTRLLFPSAKEGFEQIFALKSSDKYGNTSILSQSFKEKFGCEF